jgi:hypothetical protein
VEVAQRAALAGANRYSASSVCSWKRPTVYEMTYPGPSAMPSTAASEALRVKPDWATKKSTAWAIVHSPDASFGSTIARAPRTRSQRAVNRRASRSSP